ncbi:MAG: hypothetical protein COT14_01800 [Candidatus Diapherotrites archaeon CG08_land_8_20_14_0_20_30_16]|nr:MAG: hypothetical protein COT14_01800 [Candidatus Diapherotrites archaeon CG08_land_8_20_14_0_20_30_16]
MFDIPKLADVESAILHLVVESYTQKLISPKNCDFTKKFTIKKVDEPWTLDNTNYTTLESLQKSGEVVASFEVTPKTKELPIKTPVKDIMSAYGFTIDETDNSLCRVSFYSQTGNTYAPYITLQ